MTNNPQTANLPEIESFNITRGGDKPISVEGETRFIKEGDFRSFKKAAENLLSSLPQDVRNLVIAARRVFDIGHSGEEFEELDKSLEEFSDRVPYDPA